MTMTTSTKNKKENRVFKSLNEVRKTYFPKKDLEFLEGNTDLTQDAFMKILQQISRPVEDQDEKEKK